MENKIDQQLRLGDGFTIENPGENVVISNQSKVIESPMVEPINPPEEQSRFTDIGLLKEISRLRMITKGVKKRVYVPSPEGYYTYAGLEENAIIKRKPLEGHQGRFSYSFRFPTKVRKGAKTWIVYPGRPINTYSDKEIIPQNQIPELVLRLREEKAKLA